MQSPHTTKNMQTIMNSFNSIKDRFLCSPTASTQTAFNLSHLKLKVIFLHEGLSLSAQIISCLSFPAKPQAVYLQGTLEE